MTKPISIPNTFASATSAIPLSQLDQDFSTLANATNDLATYSNYVADTGAADAFIVNYPANTNTSSLTTGLRLQFKAANANTGASTLNVQVNGGSIGTAAIRLTDGSALPANTIIAGALVDVMYDGTNFQIMNDPSGGQEIITNLTLSGNLTVAGTSTFTGNVTGNVVNTTTSTITNLTSSNVTITGGTISNVTLDNVTVDVETFSNITINGTASFAAGSNTAPSITFTGDTNTGIYSPAADTIAFTEGGVEAMRIDSSGNVGIGTASPAFISGGGLEVYNSSVTRIKLTNSTSGTTSFDGLDIVLSSTDANIIVREAFPLLFYTSAAERMRIDSSGNVGIGTSSPAYRLQVETPTATGDTVGYFRQGSGAVAVINSTTNLVGFGNSATAGETRIFADGGSGFVTLRTNSSERMRITSTGAALVGKTATGLTTQGIQLVPAGSSAITGPSGSVPLYINNIGTSSQSLLEFRTGTAATTVPGSITTDGTNLAINGYTNLIFGTNSTTERMRIDSSGNVGIGTSSPSQVLEVSKSQDTETQVRVVNANTGSSARSGFVLGNNSNAGAASLLLNSSNNTGLGGANALNMYQGLSAPIVFFTDATERMRITSGGEVFVGTSSTFDASYKFNLYVNTANGFITKPDTNKNYNASSFRNSSNTEVGYIFCSNTATSFGTSSDYRLKENIAPMTGALDKVSQLKPVTYKWKVDGSAGQGFIAHELQAVIPDAVTGEKDGELMQGVDYGKITPLLTAALQEALAKIESLEARLAALESK